MMVTRSMMLAESVEIDISARSGMKSAVRLSPGPSLGCAKTPQKPSEPSDGHAVADVLAKVAAGELASLGDVGDRSGDGDVSGQGERFRLTEFWKPTPASRVAGTAS